MASGICLQLFLDAGFYGWRVPAFSLFCAHLFILVIYQNLSDTVALILKGVPGVK